MNSRSVQASTGFFASIVRPLVLRRAQYACEECGCTEFYGTTIDIHHEDYDDQRLDTLLAVCRPCHSELDKIRRKREAFKKQVDSITFT